jgi:hypothetical protein
MEHDFVFKQLIVHPGGYHVKYTCVNPGCDISFELPMDDPDAIDPSVKRNYRSIKQMIKGNYPDCPYTCDTDPFKQAREDNIKDST